MQINLASRFAALFLAFVASGGTGEAKEQHFQTFPLDYFKQTIFVDGVVTGDGATPFGSQGIFILDTGTERSIIESSAAQFMGLDCSSSANEYQFGEPTRQKMCRLPAFKALGYTATNLDVLCRDNFHDAEEAYRGRHSAIQGILGMDFFKGLILRIDFRRKEIQLLQRGHRGRMIQMNSVHGLLLMPVKVEGQAVELLFDTGNDSEVDAILFKPMAGSLSLKAPLSQRHTCALESRCVPELFGQAQSVSIGKIKTAPAWLGLWEGTVPPQNTFLNSAGSLGLRLFEHGAVTLDFKSNRLYFVGSFSEEIPTWARTP